MAHALKIALLLLGVGFFVPSSASVYSWTPPYWAGDCYCAVTNICYRAQWWVEVKPPDQAWVEDNSCRPVQPLSDMVAQSSSVSASSSSDPTQGIVLVSGASLETAILFVAGIMLGISAFRLMVKW